MTLPVDSTLAIPSAAATPLRAIAFDFNRKEMQPIDPAAASEHFARGSYVWFDVEDSGLDTADRLLQSVSASDREFVLEALRREPVTQAARYPECLFMTVIGLKPDALHPEYERLDVVIRQECLLTVHRQPVWFLNELRRECATDFQKHAQSPSFLIYEIWDHVLENYQRVHRRLEERATELQRDMLHKVDEEIFERVAAMDIDLLDFRHIVLPARAVLTELATRKSVYVNEITQQFLANMVPPIELILQDVLVSREILTQTLNLNMSRVAHRTNETVKRLTVVSVIFLPLTFLCGVYGMNFDYIPETKWRWGYALFWSVVLLFTGLLVAFLRRLKLL